MMNKAFRLRTFFFFFALLIGNQSMAAPACTSSEHRAFDFWLGNWEVHTPDGKLAGTNLITLEYDGCVIHEHYKTNQGYSGESLNMYDTSRKLWHQSWVDNTGLLLLLEGGFNNGSMILEGQTNEANGRITRHRISWTPNENGSVRQLWETSDNKGNWKIAFDGLYTKK